MLEKQLDIKFDEKGLIPVIIQDAHSNEVLMMAYMNEESLKKTLDTGITHFWSRSRHELWQKGEISGNIQEVQEISLDCDGDTLLIKVHQKGGACHTGYRSCFHKSISTDGLNLGITGEKVFDPNQVYQSKSAVLQEVYDVVTNRKKNPQEGSYTNYLFEKGIDKILKKVGEECAEVIIASKNGIEDEVIYEVADLFYHLIVTLVEQGIGLDQIYDELQKRR